MQKLFICHHTKYDAEVTALSEELQFRGIPTWVDHLGGFGAGVQTTTEARRIISSPEESFGMLIFATPESISRTFIKNVELDTALRRKSNDNDYLLIPIPYQMEFSELSVLSRQELGEDLVTFNGQAIRDKDPEGIRAAELRPQFAAVARAVLKERLALIHRSADSSSPIHVNLCTRQTLPAEPDDRLEINVPNLSGIPDFWHRLSHGLVDLRHAIRQFSPQPVIRINGSKHLTAAFLVGRVFSPATTREVSTRQGDEYWTTACTPAPDSPFSIKVTDGVADSDALFVEIAATDKDVHIGVLDYSRRSGRLPAVSLAFRQKVSGAIDNFVASAMAKQVREQVIAALGTYRVSSIHIFMSVPQGLATLIGYELNATLPTQMYEYVDGQYRPSAYIKQADLG